MLLVDEPMKKHCSLRAGGAAKYLFVPDDIDNLVDFLKNNNKPVLMLGLGSNTLVRDNGFDGVVIKLNNFKNITIDNKIMDVDAGVTSAKFARFCDVNNINGAEFLSAIPGTIGGALAMNAGAFGSEIWNFVKEVTTIDLFGVVHKRTQDCFVTGYRSVVNKNHGEFFLGARLEFNNLNKQQNIKQLLAQRNSSQPIGEPSCGSVFKNPQNNYAAALIEKSELKGFCIGGACVSIKHANFIINKNNASAADIEDLIKYIQKIVAIKFNIALETEVRII